MSAQALAALRHTVTVDWKNQTEEQAKRHLINTAKFGIAGILNEQTITVGVRPIATVYANRPGNPDLESVKLPGPIVALFDHRPAIVKMAMEALRTASPVDSGRYRDSHMILLNGVRVTSLPQSLKAADEIVITNPVPYARRIEIGKTKTGRDFVLQVPNRIYERVAKNKLLPKFRNVADVSFAYLTLTGAHVIQGGLSSHYLTTVGSVGKGLRQVRRKRRQAKGRAIQAPAIFIRPLGVVPV